VGYRVVTSRSKAALLINNSHKGSLHTLGQLVHNVDRKTILLDGINHCKALAEALYSTGRVTSEKSAEAAIIAIPTQ
jgi:hypothetical protein